MSDQFLSDQQLARRYGVHRATIWRWVRSDLTFPKPLRLGPQSTRWRLRDVEAWEQRRVGTPHS
jgi:predicted DNA-binding transcriptional regulator AlpA